MNCHVCGETKDKDEFRYLPYFSRYRKDKVQWCKECQKMYMEMKRNKERMEKFIKDPLKFIVSFQ